MKIIVTGGAGFIGSNFIYYMMEKHSEDQIICLDALYGLLVWIGVSSVKNRSGRSSGRSPYTSSVET